MDNSDNFFKQCTTCLRNIEGHKNSRVSTQTQSSLFRCLEGHTATSFGRYWKEVSQGRGRSKATGNRYIKRKVREEVRPEQNHSELLDEGLC